MTHRQASQVVCPCCSASQSLGWYHLSLSPCSLFLPSVLTSLRIFQLDTHWSYLIRVLTFRLYFPNCNIITQMARNSLEQNWMLSLDALSCLIELCWRVSSCYNVVHWHFWGRPVCNSVWISLSCIYKLASPFSIIHYGITAVCHLLRGRKATSSGNHNFSE